MPPGLEQARKARAPHFFASHLIDTPAMPVSRHADSAQGDKTQCRMPCDGKPRKRWPRNATGKGVLIRSHTGGKHGKAAFPAP